MRGSQRLRTLRKDFYDAGYDVDFVSPNGGYVPLDPISLSPEMMGAEDWEYYTDHDYMNKFGQTLSPKEVNPSDYQAIYFAGGHGAIWDLRNNKELNDIALSIYNNQERSLFCMSWCGWSTRY